MHSFRAANNRKQDQAGRGIITMRAIQSRSNRTGHRHRKGGARMRSRVRARFTIPPPILSCARTRWWLMMTTAISVGFLKRFTNLGTSEGPSGFLELQNMGNATKETSDSKIGLPASTDSGCIPRLEVSDGSDMTGCHYARNLLL